MSQNERLRALLEEALDWMIDDTCYDCERGGCELRKRIRAALAEPGDVHPSNLSEAAEEEVARLERFVAGVIAERDHFKAMLRERAEELLAAREEIERLRALYVEARVDGFRDGRRSGTGNKR